LRLSRAQWRFADQSFIRPFEQRGHKGPVDNQTYLINLKGEALASNLAAERLPATRSLPSGWATAFVGLGVGLVHSSGSGRA